MDIERTERPLTITVEAAGRMLGISRGLAYELVRRGQLRSLRLGRRLVIPRQAIDELLDPSGSLSRTAEDGSASRPPGPTDR